MFNNPLLKLFIILIIFFFVNGTTLAFYKPKMMVTEFDDPKNWNKPFSPGKIIAHRLENELIKKNNFQIIPERQIQNMGKPKILDPKINDKPLSKMPKASKMNQGLKKMRDMDNQNSMNRFLDETEYKVAKNSQYKRSMEIEPAIHYYEDISEFNIIPIQNPNNGMNEGNSIGGEPMDILNDPIPWPAKMGKVSEKASLYKVIGQIVKFNPGNIDSSLEISENKDVTGSENAELVVKIQLVQNKTGRVVQKQNFKAFSNSGKRTFSEDIDLAFTNDFNQKSSSMGLALTFIIKEMVAFVKNTISTSALEGEIISIKNENVLINIGRQNGVEIGDKFRVFSLSLNLADPLTEADLGDIYVKMGVIRIVETMLGFSKAMIIVGKELLPGNLVQSFKKIKNSYNAFSSDFTTDDFKEKIP